MKLPFRISERLQILRDHLYSHIPLDDRMSKIDDKLLLLLNQTVDIRQLKPATGKLRLVQEVGIQILRILQRSAQKAGVDFWLGYGTMLGAIRHQGFVPWDDDLDISLMQEDYDKFCAYLGANLPVGLVFEKWLDRKGNSIGIARVTDERTGVHVDLYAYWRVPKTLNSSGVVTDWEHKYQKEYAEIAQYTYCNGVSDAVKKRIDDWLQGHSYGDGDTDGIVTAMTFVSASPRYRRIYAAHDIFPLRRALFEGCEFNVPVHAELVLNEIYGDYLQYPSDAGHPLHSDMYKGVTSVQLRLRIDELNAIVCHL